MQTRLPTGALWTGAWLAAAWLSGCNGAQTAPPTGAGAGQPGAQAVLSPMTGQRLLAMTMAHDVAPASHRDRGRSRMAPRAKRDKRLLYVSNWSTNDVDVYDYPSGKSVGTLTGFEEPYGQCVDANGDVYIAEFGNGEVVEYAHGGTTPLQTFQTNGYAIGCSLDRQNDLAATDFYTSTGAGDVCIWKNGKGDSTCYDAPSSCYYMWSGGYDDKGNLIVEGEYDSIGVCALLAGASSMTTLSFAGTIDFPGGTMWDGQYITLTDQEASGGSETGIIQTTLSGSTLMQVGETTLTDDCDGNYDDIPGPFIVGKKNTPVNAQQGTVVLGGNLYCDSSSGLPLWHYPQGGSPFDVLTKVQSGYGAVVSIAR